MNNFIAERNTTLKKFCNIAGRENAARWALKKYLESIDTLLENNYYNCKLVTDIRNAIARKANVKRQYVNMPKWERLVNRAKKAIKDERRLIGDGTLSGGVAYSYTYTPKKGEKEFELAILKPEPEHHSPHVHIYCGDSKAVILLSNPDKIFKGDLPKDVLKNAVKIIKTDYDLLLETYYAHNKQQKKQEKKAVNKRSSKK